jgi:hypothetical protein
MEDMDDIPVYRPEPSCDVKLGVILVPMWARECARPGLLIVLSLALLGCAHPEQDVVGLWESKDMILSISREGENAQHYTVQWKQPSKLASGFFSSSFRNGTIEGPKSLTGVRTELPGDPAFGDITYSRGHLLWRGEEFRRARPEEWDHPALH